MLASIPWNGRTAVLLPLAAVSVPAIIMMVVGWISWVSVWENAAGDMNRSAQSAAEYGKRTLEGYSIAAGRLNDRLRGMSDEDIRRNEQPLQAELKTMMAETSQSDLAYVIDRNGYPLVATNLYPVPRQSSLLDRDYFKELHGPDRPDVVISKTFLGRFDGLLLFSVARPRSDTGNPPPADGFDGIVLVSVSPIVMANGLGRLLTVPTDRMALLRADGHIISTTGGITDTNQPLPRVAPESPFYSYVAQGAESATYISTTAIAGSQVLLSMQRIEGFSIYAVSLRPTGEITARWWGIMGTQLAVGVPATILLLMLSLRVMRNQRQLATSNQILKQYNDLSASRLLRTQRFGLVGTFEHDLRTGISRRSPEYMAIHGLPAVTTSETHADWVNRLHPDDRKRAEQELAEALSDLGGVTEYAQSYRILTPNGEVRWIAARGEVIRDSNGHAYMLLGAHVDVTPLRKTELALAESDARLRLAQEAVGIGSWEWLPTVHELACSPKMLEIWGLPDTEPTVALRRLLRRVHRDDRAQVCATMRKLRQTPAVSLEFRILRASAMGGVEMFWLAARANVVVPLEVTGKRVLGVVFDITQGKRAEELTMLMAHEVEHRAKNALTVVSSLIRMTKAGTVEELARAMEGRVRALSATMALLGQGQWQGTGLRE
ncbi:MAG: PAS domain-containing protein, partial [Candidatus Saccharibacteria bacterium]|nr:PAS domain-containing protein [Pseudorhodobacter sp.]